MGIIVKVLEFILFFFVKIFLYLAKGIYWLGEAVKAIVGFMFMVAVFLGICYALMIAGSFWVKFAIIGMALFFLCFIALLIWRRDKLMKVMDKIF